MIQSWHSVQLYVIDYQQLHVVQHEYKTRYFKSSHSIIEFLSINFFFQCFFYYCCCSESSPINILTRLDGTFTPFGGSGWKPSSRPHLFSVSTINSECKQTHNDPDLGIHAESGHLSPPPPQVQIEPPSTFILFIGKVPWLTFLCPCLQPLSSKEPECSFSINVSPLLKAFCWLLFYSEQNLQHQWPPRCGLNPEAHSHSTAIMPAGGGILPTEICLEGFLTSFKTLEMPPSQGSLGIQTLISHLPLLCWFFFLGCLLLYFSPCNKYFSQRVAQARQWHMASSPVGENLARWTHLIARAPGTCGPAVCPGR